MKRLTMIGSPSSRADRALWGGRLIRTLVAQGWQVRALARSRSAIAAVENLGAVPVQGELNDREALRKGMSGSKVVFHVAAMFKLWGDRKQFDAVNVEGMRTLVDAALARRRYKRSSP